MKSRSPKVDLTSKLRLTFLSVETVRYDSDGVLRAVRLPLPIAATSSLDNTRNNSKIKQCTCTCQPVVSEPKRTRKKVDFGSFGGGGRLCS